MREQSKENDFAEKAKNTMLVHAEGIKLWMKLGSHKRQKVKNRRSTMEVKNIIYELLYLGIKIEMQRGRWKGRYKKTLKKHIFALDELQKCLHTSEIDTSRTAIKKIH